MENNDNDQITQKPLDNLDVLILFILTACCFIIRYWRISLPPTTVFDEVYFGNFTNYYIQSQFYHDIHPPLAKILMFYIANLSEYNGSMSFAFNAKGYTQPDYVQLRITPATFSALVFPLIYISMRFSGFSYTSSLCSSLLGLFDTSLATEGRHILTDGILHFFCILHVAVLCYTMSIKAKFRTTSKFYIWHILTGITLGCACTCKNTAWGLTVFDAFCYALQFTDMVSIKKFRLQKVSSAHKSKKLNHQKEIKEKVQLQAEKDDKNTNTEKFTFSEENDTETVTSSHNFNSPSATANISADSPPPAQPDAANIKDDQKTNSQNETNSVKTVKNNDNNRQNSTNNSNNFSDGIDASNGGSIEAFFESLYMKNEKILSIEKVDNDSDSDAHLIPMSSSPLDIQASISNSAIISTTSAFSKGFDEGEFVRGEGTGGDLFDYFFDVCFFGFTLALIALCVYVLTFYVHFILLPYAGKGTAYLRPDMRAQLIPNQCATCRKPNATRPRRQAVRAANYDETYDECISSALYAVRLKKPSLFLRTFILTFRMHSGNMGIVGFHDSQSFPKHWPVLSSVSTYFWGMNGREIRCFGNAIVYYLVLFALIILTLYSVARATFCVYRLVTRQKKSENNRNTSLHFPKNVSPLKKLVYLATFSVDYLCEFFSDDFETDFDWHSFVPFCNQKWLLAFRFIVGYSVSYFPFYWIPRTLYLYHYLIPLIFGCLTFGSMVEVLLPTRYRSVFIVFVCIAAAFGFWLWSPYVYGTDRHDLNMMIWTRRWIDGDEEHKKAKLENNLKKNKK